jgi:hypothetical protein
MNKRSYLAVTILSLVSLSWDPAQANEPPKHSLESDYGFMIGAWTCHVTQAGTPERDVSVEYEWAYDKHILRENMRFGDKVIGEFLTSYDKATDRFKGVGIGPWGYVIWENAGFQEGRLSERGYVFDSGKMTPVSRSEFERLSSTHYIVRDFEPASAASSGAATDTEDCTKVK